mgnify:CR=1 FL=1
MNYRVRAFHYQARCRHLNRLLGPPEAALLIRLAHPLPADHCAPQPPVAHPAVGRLRPPHPILAPQLSDPLELCAGECLDLVGLPLGHPLQSSESQLLHYDSQPQ